MSALNTHRQAVITAAATVAPLLSLLPATGIGAAREIVRRAQNPPRLGRDFTMRIYGSDALHQHVLAEADATGVRRELAHAYANDRIEAHRLAIAHGLPSARAEVAAQCVASLWSAMGSLTSIEPWRASEDCEFIAQLAALVACN